MLEVAETEKHRIIINISFGKDKFLKVFKATHIQITLDAAKIPRENRRVDFVVPLTVTFAVSLLLEALLAVFVATCKTRIVTCIIAFMLFRHSEPYR